MSKTAYPGIIESLVSINTQGFTQLQAAAYIALLMLGEETGSAIAQASGINRSKIYDILNQLESMRAVKKVSRDGKTRYIAIPPDVVLPEILDKFSQELDKTLKELNALSELKTIIEPSLITLTTLELKDLDSNNYRYLVTSNDRTRVEFVDQLEKENRPGKNVRILNLNEKLEERGIVLLIGAVESYLFPSPVGQSIEAIKIEQEDISKFLLGIIESGWTKDIPDTIRQEINTGERVALSVGKSLFMRHEFNNGQIYTHERPVSFLLTPEHLSFFYEGKEDHKVPLMALDQVELEDSDVIRLIFVNQSKQRIGELHMRIVGEAIYLKNIIRSIIIRK